jgi:hypothetical protein
MPDLFDQLAIDLPRAVPPERVALAGAWSRSTRNASASQPGSEAGAQVVDEIWAGAVDCTSPTVGIAFLRLGGEIYWIKSAPAAFGQPLHVSLTYYADPLHDRATFGAGWGESSLPGVPVRRAADRAETCRLGTLEMTTGVPHVVCEADGATFFIVLLQGALARTGRCRNWHLRAEPAALLPAGLRSLFTQRRSGVWRPLRHEATANAGVDPRSS